MRITVRKASEGAQSLYKKNQAPTRLRKLNNNVELSDPVWLINIGRLGFGFSSISLRSIF